MDSELHRLNHRSVRRAFDRAAVTYDKHAVLQRAVGDRLLENLELFSLDPKRVVDLGAGTGYCTAGIERRFPRTAVVVTDISTEMLKVARHKSRRWFGRRRFVCMSAHGIPLADRSVDVVFSNLTLQWCDLDRAFSECMRILNTDGLLIFSSLGPDTLRELRAAFAAVNDEPHVNDFIDMHDVGDALIRAGFQSPVMETDRITMTYDNVRDVMADLRGIGAVNQIESRRRGLTTKRVLQTVAERYERYRTDGVLPATYEIVYGHAFRPARDARPQDGSTVASFPLSELKRRS